ncbi:MAG: hypothetical protein RLY97_1968 [Pseudomonadota bacterium]
MLHLPFVARYIALMAVLSAVLMAGPASAEKDSKAPPFWGSLKAKEVNMRSGPGEDYHITHVYRREGLPIKVLREMEIWRLVEDPGGTRGWMMVRFITRSRSAIIIGKDVAPMYEAPTSDSKLKWRLAAGVMGKLGDCASGWCHFDVAGHGGYVRQERLWGAGGV